MPEYYSVSSFLRVENGMRIGGIICTMRVRVCRSTYPVTHFARIREMYNIIFFRDTCIFRRPFNSRTEWRRSISRAISLASKCTTLIKFNSRTSLFYNNANHDITRDIRLNIFLFYKIAKKVARDDF